MTTTTAHIIEAPTRRPGALRRTGLVLAALPAIALPCVWGIASVRSLVSGPDDVHTFHAVTGQGLLLVAVWLAMLVPLLLAGWRGQHPGPVAAVGYPLFVVAAVVCGAVATANGGLFVGILLTVSLGLTWLAMPQRPTVRGLRASLDPVVAPLALVTAAVYTPYVVDQLQTQQAMADEMTRVSHYFDNAWLMVTAMLFLLAAATTRGTAPLVVWAGVLQVVVGTAAAVWTDRGAWSYVAIGLGVVAVAAGLFRRSSGLNGTSSL